MKKQNLFSELDCRILQRFSHKLGQLYPAISRISIYDSVDPGAAYILVVKVKNDNSPKYQEARCIDIITFRDISGVPDIIRYHEDDWMVWAEDHDDITPNELVVEGSESPLYTSMHYLGDKDRFIKSLRVEVVNDSEISIQEPGKSPIPCHYKDIGYKKEKTDPWKLLIDTLRQDSSIISLPQRTLSGTRNKGDELKIELFGLSRIDTDIKSSGIHNNTDIKSFGIRNKEYDRKRKNLSRLNEKLTDFFRDKFQIDLPKGYKLYESYGHNQGKYSFKFKVPGLRTFTGPCTPDRCAGMSKDQPLAKIKSLADQHNKTGDCTIFSDLGMAASIAKEKGWITEDEMEKLLNPDPTEKEKKLLSSNE